MNPSCQKGWWASSHLVVCVALSMLCVTACDQQNDPAAPSGTTPGAPPAGTATILPQEELAAAFENSSALVAEAKTADVWRQFKAQQQVDFSPGANGLTVIAGGTDPSLLLPAFAAGKKFVLQVVIHSPADTAAQLFYLTRSQPGYAESRSQLVNLTKGRNVVYFRLDQPDLADPLRLDPGSVAGEYLIESMVARAIP